MKEGNKITCFEEVDNLFLTLYLIGYSNEGESILITISSSKPEKKLIYSGIIDSCDKNGINVTTEVFKNVLAENNDKKKKLNLLCWTHPHDDHTKGITKIIKQYCDGDTLIAMPNIFYMNPKILSTYSNKAIKCIQQLCYKKHVKNRANLEILSDEDDLQIIDIGKGKNKHQIIVKHYGPYDNIAFTQNPENIDLNKLSCSLMLSFNGLNIFLGGDTENMNIKSFRDFPKRINFIKIPHHTSSTASELTKKLNSVEVAEVACTTMFGDKLPEKDLLSEYTNLSTDVFCTSKSIIDSITFKHNNDEFEYDESIKVSSLNDVDYGILKIVIDVINGEYTPYLVGDATSVTKI